MKQLLRITFVLLLFAASVQDSVACSFRNDRDILIECTVPPAAITTLHPTQGAGGIDIRADSIVLWLFDGQDASSLLEHVAQTCQEDFTSVKDAVGHALERWRARSLPMVSEYFHVKPFARQHQEALATQRNDYADCHYDEFTVVDSWIISTASVRTYCYLGRWIPPGGCAKYFVGRLAFFGFLVTHLDATTVPYLGGYLTRIIPAVISLLILLWYLRRRGDLTTFVHPTRMHLVVLPIGLLIIVCINEIVDMGLWLTLLYGMSSGLSYLGYRLGRRGKRKVQAEQ